METVILILFLVAMAAFVIGIYNRIVRLRQACHQAVSDVDVQYRQRLDLMPSLVATVRGSAEHEREALAVIVAARAAAAATGPNASANQEALSGAITRLFVVAEAYPDLKANKNFLSLQVELSDIENKIMAARRFFNMSVAEYNAALSQFPTLLFARVLGFEPITFYAIPQADRVLAERPPTVRF